MPINSSTHLSLYDLLFPEAFQFFAQPGGSNAHFSNYLDDGAVFYLNGVEIQRAFMPAPRL